MRTLINIGAQFRIPADSIVSIAWSLALESRAIYAGRSTPAESAQRVAADHWNGGSSVEFAAFVATLLRVLENHTAN